MPPCSMDQLVCMAPLVGSVLPASSSAAPAQEYKNAASFLLNRVPSRAEREALVDTLDSLSRQVVRGIAEGRSLTAKQVRVWAGVGAMRGV